MIIHLPVKFYYLTEKCLANKADAFLVWSKKSFGQCQTGLNQSMSNRGAGTAVVFDVEKTENADAGVYSVGSYNDLSEVAVAIGQNSSRVCCCLTCCAVDGMVDRLNSTEICKK